MKNASHLFASTQEEQECRCHCGNLLARLRTTGVELKCRRCKRTVLIPWEAVVMESEGERFHV